MSLRFYLHRGITTLCPIGLAKQERNSTRLGSTHHSFIDTVSFRSLAPYVELWYKIHVKKNTGSLFFCLLDSSEATPPHIHRRPNTPHYYHHWILVYPTINIVTRPIFHALSIALGGGWWYWACGYLLAVISAAQFWTQQRHIMVKTSAATDITVK